MPRTNEQNRQYHKEYYWKHYDKFRADRLEYYAKHREELIQYQRDYRKNNRDKVLADGRKRWQNPEFRKKSNEHRARSEKAKMQDPEYRRQRREYFRQYYAQHPEILLKMRGLSPKYHWTNRKKVIDLLGGKCVVCGITDIRILQINHRNGGGAKDFGHHSQRLMRSILRGERKTDDLDVRCANHNIIYEFECGRRHTYE